MNLGTSEEAKIKKINRQVNVIVKRLVKSHPGKPLHEISLMNIKLATGAVILKSKKWIKEKVTPRRPDPNAAIRRHDNTLRHLPFIGNEYSYYEIAHTMYTRIVVSHLLHNGIIENSDKADVEKLIGRLYNHGEQPIQEEQKEALSKIIARKGENYTNSLLKEAAKKWRELNEENSILPGRKLLPTHLKNAWPPGVPFYPRELAVIRDMYNNPADHIFLGSSYPPFNDSFKESPVKYAMEKLRAH